MASTSPSAKVKFQDGDSDKHVLVKQVPTQRYDRKEIQKRLEMENWMEEQLSNLFESEVGSRHWAKYFKK